MSDPFRLSLRLARAARPTRNVALAVSFLAANVYFLSVVNEHYAIRQWLFFIYLMYWLLALAFNAACLSAGFALLRVLVPHGLPLRERLVQSMALGVFTFYLGAFFAGLLHLYGVGFFVGWPLLLAAGGAVPVYRTARRAARALRGVRRIPGERRSPLATAITGFGVLALGLIYLSVMTPENVAYDARWYHLPIAEHYAAQHGVGPFPEGWYQGALPHLSSFLYTWAMLWPKVHFVDRVLLCSHIEFSLFLWVLFAVTVLVRRLVPGRRAGLAWTAVFLFPGVFLYDSNLNTTADHIAAFWGPPIFLALARAWPKLDLRWSILLGVLLAAALGTKYQAASLAALPVAAVAFRAAWLAIRPGPQPWWRPIAGAAAAGATTVVLWAPHWLKNLVWYGDPCYPFLHRIFHTPLWTPDTDLRLELIRKVHLWTPQGTFPERVSEALNAVWSFSFIPNDWAPMHRNVPVFGSLFTLLLLALPFQRARGRLWGLFLAGNVGVFVWYWISHQDRYLQALVPWFASATAASISLAWSSGALVRIALGALVASQVVWGGDVPFIGTHRVANASPIKIAVDRLASGFDRDFARRTRAFGDLVEIGNALPPDARVLIHEEELHIGLQHPTVSDWIDWQGGLSYGRLRSPAELDDKLKSWGVTHIVMVAGRSKDRDALPGDVVFFDYATHFAREWKTFGGWTVFELPSVRPPDQPYGEILWLGCENLYAKGRYPFTDMMLTFYSHLPKSAFPGPRVLVDADNADAVNEAVTHVDAVGLDSVCQTVTPAMLDASFTHVTDRHSLQVWIRKRATVPTAARSNSRESL